MIILDEKNIPDYVKDNLAGKLDFIKQGNVSDIVMLNGGLISSVFRLKIDDQSIVLKQAIPGRLDKLKELLGDIPEDILILFSDDRQLAEAKALQIFDKAVGNNFTPQLYYHDLDNNVMVLSQVCDDNAKLFADTMNKEVNIEHAEILAKNIATLQNNTYDKIGSLRDEEMEENVRRIKHKYEVGEVWHEIKDLEKREKAQSKAKEFIEKSLQIGKVLVHGDYYEKNILICGNNCATFDLEEGHLGDPVEDVGKLLTSYLLRIVYFKEIKEDAYQASLKLFDAYFSTLDIPEDKEEIKKRLRAMLAGCMLFRVDGISKKFISWTQEESKKEIVREFALSIILDEETSIPDIIKEFYLKP